MSLHRSVFLKSEDERPLPKYEKLSISKLVSRDSWHFEIVEFSNRTLAVRELDDPGVVVALPLGPSLLNELMKFADKFHITSESELVGVRLHLRTNKPNRRRQPWCEWTFTISPEDGKS